MVIVDYQIQSGYSPALNDVGFTGPDYAVVVDYQAHLSTAPPLDDVPFALNPVDPNDPGDPVYLQVDRVRTYAAFDAAPMLRWRGP